MSQSVARPVPRAIAGTFSDLQVRTHRGLVQIIVEVPLERAQQVTDLLGFPKPGSELWVAIAPLGFDPYATNRLETPRSEAVAPQHRELDTERRNAVTACAIRCGEPSFQRWLLGKPPAGGWTEEQAAAEVRRRLGVGSRADIAVSTEAYRRWKTLLRQYMEATYEPPPR